MSSRHYNRCLKHASKRAMERLGIVFDKYDNYFLVDQIKSGGSKYLMKNEKNLNRFFYEVSFMGRNIVILFDDELKVVVTFYSQRMFKRKLKLMRRKVKIEDTNSNLLSMIDFRKTRIDKNQRKELGLVDKIAA